ncbi:hypothetical protein [Candidatus Binatus soli]|jgi:hypothetical protein
MGRTQVRHHIPTWIDGKHPIVHDKVIIVDERRINYRARRPVS